MQHRHCQTSGVSPKPKMAINVVNSTFCGPFHRPEVGIKLVACTLKDAHRRCRRRSFVQRSFQSSRPPATMEFSFIPIDETGSIAATDRKAVRSRCMQGVNRRKDSRRSRQAHRRQLGLAKAPACRKMPEAEGLRSCGASSAEEAHLPIGQTMQGVTASGQVLGPPASLPDAFTVSLACCEDIHTRELLWKCKYAINLNTRPRE